MILINPNMIVKQKKMDKRINYKLNVDTIFASASSIGISAIKTIRRISRQTKVNKSEVNQKKYLKYLQKRNY